MGGWVIGGWVSVVGVKREGWGGCELNIAMQQGKTRKRSTMVCGWFTRSIELASRSEEMKFLRRSLGALRPYD